MTGLCPQLLTPPGTEHHPGTVLAREGDRDVPQTGQAILQALTGVVRVEVGSKTFVQSNDRPDWYGALGEGCPALTNLLQDLQLVTEPPVHFVRILDTDVRHLGPGTLLVILTAELLDTFLQDLRENRYL